MKKFKKILTVAESAIILLTTGITAAATESAETVYLGGEPIGIKLYTDGVLVIELESYYDGSGYVCPAKSAGIRVNDVIKEIDGNKIDSNEDLAELTRGSNGQTLCATIERNDKEIEKTITPVKNTAGMYLIGAWVRDSCAGIGTATFYDEDGGYYAALGHGVCDAETSALMPLESGEAVLANITGVDKSSVGSVGCLNGCFTDNSLGSLIKNTEIGIYGKLVNSITNCKQKITVSSPSEVKVGEATLYTTVFGDSPKEYKIEITSVNNYSADSNENFVIKITDEKLLEKTGGIVQGMSGSPIVQNGKLIGAVTHVFVNSPQDGYGIFAQNMVLDYDE